MYSNKFLKIRAQSRGTIVLKYLKSLKLLSAYYWDIILFFYFETKSLCSLTKVSHLAKINVYCNHGNRDSTSPVSLPTGQTQHGKIVRNEF